MLFTSNPKFLSSIYFSVPLQVKENSLSEGLFYLGPTVTTLFLGPVPASALATAIACTAAYLRNQLDDKKVEGLFNATKYFEIIHYLREQPLMLTYQASGDKYKVHKGLLVYYHRTMKFTTPTTETNTITTVKHNSKSHNYHHIDRFHHKVSIDRGTRDRSAPNATLTTEHEVDAWHLVLPAEVPLQHVANQENPSLAGQTKILIMKMQSTYTIDYHDTDKGIVTVPKDVQLLPTNYTPYTLTLQAHLTQKSAHGSNKRLD